MEITSSELILQYLTALYEASIAYIETESNENLRCVLKSKTRMSNSLMYDSTACVYYKRKDSDKWKGPETVIGKENKQGLVKNDGS